MDEAQPCTREHVFFFHRVFFTYLDRVDAGALSSSSGDFSYTRRHLVHISLFFSHSPSLFLNSFFLYIRTVYGSMCRLVNVVGLDSAWVRSGAVKRLPSLFLQVPRDGGKVELTEDVNISLYRQGKMRWRRKEGEGSRMEIIKRKVSQKRDVSLSVLASVFLSFSPSMRQPENQVELSRKRRSLHFFLSFFLSRGRHKSDVR